MKKVVLYFALSLCGLSVRAQSENDDIKATIDKLFQGMKNNDSTLLKAVLHESCTLKTVSKNKEGEAIIIEEKIAGFIKAVGTKREGVKLDERLTSYDIKTDGSMAMAWTPYRFYVNEQFRHCGVNLFSLMKTKDSWKIVSILDTRRKEECN